MELQSFSSLPGALSAQAALNNKGKLQPGVVYSSMPQSALGLLDFTPDTFQRVTPHGKGWASVAPVRFGEGLTTDETVYKALITPFMTPADPEHPLPFTPLMIAQSLLNLEQARMPYVEAKSAIESMGLIPGKTAEELTPLDMVLALMANDDQFDAGDPKRKVKPWVLDPAYRQGVESWLQLHSKPQGEIPALVEQVDPTAPWQSTEYLYNLMLREVPPLTSRWLLRSERPDLAFETFRSHQWSLEALTDYLKSKEA